MIQDVIIVKKQVISDDRGKILHMLRNDDKNFSKFGEIYFSYVYPNKIKAWHIHKKMTLNYVAAFGKIKLVLYDDRKNSKTFGKIQEIFSFKPKPFISEYSTKYLERLYFSG